MKRPAYILTFLLVSMTMVASAQPVFNATVSRTTLSTSDRFELVFTLENTASASGFRAPSLKDFRVLGGPFQSSSYQIINGKTSQSLSIKYVLQPLHAGTYTIGAATIRAGSKSLTTSPVTITVTDAPVREDNEDGGESDLISYLNKNFYIRSTLSKADLYKGESVVLIYQLFVNAGGAIYDYRVNGATVVPDYHGFYAEESDVSNLKGEYRNINGQRFLVQTIKQVRLTPQVSGDLKVDPLTVDATIAIRKQSRNNSFFDEFFGGPFSSSYDRYDHTTTAPATTVKVRDFPAGAPESFNGAVGQFDMETAISATDTKTGEPITYTVSLSGKGNMSLFAEPELELPPGWEVYDPDIEESGSRKSYAYLLIPGNPGEYTLPSYEWTYFDPDRGRYFTLRSDEYTVAVAEGDGYQSVSGGSGEEVEAIDSDIRYIDTRKLSFRSDGQGAYPLWWTYAGIGIPFAAMLFFLVAATRKPSTPDLLQKRNQQAGRMAKKRVKHASELVRSGKRKAFYDEAVRVMWDYLSHKFRIPPSELNREHLQKVLTGNKIDPSLTESTLALQQTFEMAVFAPATSGMTPAEHLNQLEQWIIDMEKATSK